MNDKDFLAIIHSISRDFNSEILNDELRKTFDIKTDLLRWPGELKDEIKI